MKNDIVLLSTAEWDNPFWTNKQHVSVELAKLGYRVFYIDSLGLRQPSMNSSDLSRIFKRVKKALKRPIEVRKNIWVWSPILLPFQKYKLIRKINYIILNCWLNFWLKQFKFKKNIFWTYNPITLSLFDTKKYKKLIYHCVDNIKAQPGMPIEIISKNEKELFKKSNIVFTTSKNLLKNAKKYNSESYYFSNVADFDHFSKALDSDLKIPNDIKEIPKPIIGFIGAISGYKLDFELINYIALKRANYSIILIGKVGEGDPDTDISRLKEQNITLLGAKDYQKLPNYLKAIDIAILPNRLNEYTKSMFPMKFFEYLSAGKPVVSVKLDALRLFKNIVYLAEDYDDFIYGIDRFLKEYNIENGIEVAKEFTYKSRMIKMMKIVEEK
jgi:hypothetical protein